MFARTPSLVMLAHSEKNHSIFCRMDSAGLLSVSMLLVLALYILFSYNCGPSKCGFENPQPQHPPKYAGISDLPEAPQNNLADVNSLPYQDPAMVKSSSDMLRQLKQDMSGFKDFELGNMPDISDPSVKLPITRFKGDYQRVTDELLVVDRTPGVQPSLSVQLLNEIAANLRFLQRTYRTYSNNQMVPEPQTPMCQVGASEPVEGFFVAKGTGEVCSRPTDCTSGNCRYLTPRPSGGLGVCSDSSSGSSITTTPTNDLRLYTQDECKCLHTTGTNMTKVWQQVDGSINGKNIGICYKSETNKNMNSSYSLICNDMNSGQPGAVGCHGENGFHCAQNPTLGHKPSEINGGSGSTTNTGEILKTQDDFPIVNGMPTPHPLLSCPSNRATVVQYYGYNNYFNGINVACYPSGTTQASSVFQNDNDIVIVMAPKDSEVKLMDATGNIIGTLNNNNKEDTSSEPDFPPNMITKPFFINSPNNSFTPGIKFSSITFTLPGSPPPTPTQTTATASPTTFTSWASGSSSSTAAALTQMQTQTQTTPGSNVGSNVTTTPTSTPTYSGDPNQARITRTQLDLLVQKLNIEITRLQASGTTDPIIRARVNVFMKIRQSLKDIQTALDKGTMNVADIPILVKDYNNFLPALGNSNTGIAALLSETGFSSLASLFSSYTNGDITNSKINNHLLHIYARALLSGLSYKFDVSYTSPNEVAARRAEAVKAAYDAGDNGTELGMNLAPAKMITNHPRMMHGSRGSFESHIRHMDMNGTERDSDGYSRPFGLGQRQGQGQGEGGSAGGFNWKARAENIYDNVKRAGMEPNDYGIDPEVYENTQQSDFSWRGYTKMVCSRLATNAEAGIAEKMGCPPASWKGWRS
jgi:hypothetical protein